MELGIRVIDRLKSAVAGRTYELTMPKDYVSKWGMVQAVREFIQNALDSQSPFVYEFSRSDKGWTLVLDSESVTLSPQTLLLGATNKRDDKDAIGSFGEGYKLALLVLCRLGYEVAILNGNVIWVPQFKKSPLYGVDVLTIDERFLPTKNSGLSVHIHGLSDNDVEQIKASCLLMQEKIGEIKSTQYGDILLDQPHKLYVGNLFICDTKLKYGYNIKPRCIPLERDRQTVSGWDLQFITGQCWLETGEHERVAQMIYEQVPDVEMVAYDAPELIKEACYKIFRQRHPKSWIAATAEEARRRIEKGLVDIVYVGSTVYHAVSDSPSYRKEYEASGGAIRTEYPRDILLNWVSAYKEQMTEEAVSAFYKLIDKAKNWREV